MAYLSREDFLKMQEDKKGFSANTESKTRVGFFKLNDDGDESVVRFAYSDPNQFEVYTVHPVTVDGKFRKVNCLRNFNEPVDKCPLCSSGQTVQQKFYIKLIEYTRDETGAIVASPKIWERPTSYINILNNLFTEYGDISECVFKVKRSGEKGSMQTTYSIMYANPSIYNTILYPKDFTAFDEYKVIGGPILDKSFEELKEMVSETGESVSSGLSETTTSQPRRVTY